ncbi:fidgetin-like protein 1 [Mercenaria mercenaria]|uniref:fidgetin-like protein 1 n=1 Tax=Mercenaria mercenaria TaxID=6596 RepID=UPI00234F3D4B|nr:fidgetin-like protein 1 [Mercenaria mercenaria]XP_045212613.2 fidgetin-like protein 1 [Mercenaria mercenaria]XP_045212614.2 fidgetin-like protein 1 [Mercenaria mercenaria]XP_045212615.2 fidgetin-like protein 1 [Mercenaria mercenaria]XP_045212616.2 fidgetin-like protein 1 [Mercenaria mercenaria]XP_045212617.2 fidgetin-like protein 1 [Mercenaria mercenaria]
MDFAKEHRDFLSRYQTLVLDQKFENGTPSERADLLRKTMAHLQYAKLSGLVGENVADSIKRQYEDMYINIVDSFDEHTGLNNYAEGALAICSGNKNESQSWKSSLTLEKIRSLPYIQKALKSSQESVSRLVPSHKLSAPLPQSKKENQPPSLTPQNVALPQKDSKFHFQNLRKGPESQSTDKVLNMYGSHSSDNQSGFPQSMEGPSGAQSKFCNNKLNGQNYTKQIGAENVKVNRQPLFSAAARNQAFNQYGSNQGNNRNRELYGSKRPYNQTEETWEEERTSKTTNVFRTAKQQMDIDNQKKYGGGGQNRGPVNTSSYGTGKKSLGTRRGLNSKFVPPVMNREDDDFGNQATNTITRAVLKTGGSDGGGGAGIEGLDDEKLKGIEPKMVELIMNEIMDNGPPMTWDDVAGLEFAKKTIKEIVVWPMLRPDIFTGLRGPPKGLLLFGPPGTGKTLIGKCIASQSKSTFFCISASSLTSKWVGEGEKMVRALFAVARSRQPAVVFIDEIDSLLTQRTDGENEASRRIKTEFLVQLDGASTSSEDRLLVIGATNRPQEIDEAARRRFVKRLYIPLPEYPARRTIITNLLRQQSYQLTDQQLDTICARTDGFSGADMATLCREAALGPIRDMSFGDIENISADQVRPIAHQDFEEALQNVKPSVSDKDLDIYIEWNNTFGSGHR